MDIKQKLAHNSNFTTSNRGSKDIKYLVVHYTANNGDTAKGNCNYFQSPNRNASAHYFVDENEVYQSVEDKNIAWHCGTKSGYKHKYCRNSNSIGVELCSRKDSKGNYYFKELVINNSAALIKDLMDKYDIQIDNVVRHYDVTGKICPAPLVDENEWKKFKNILIEEGDEVVETVEMIIDGKKQKVDRILKDNENYVKLHSLGDAGYDVGYNSSSKLATLDMPVTQIPIVINGNKKNVDRISKSNTNYVKLRDLESDNIIIGYKNNMPTVDTK